MSLRKYIFAHAVIALGVFQIPGLDEVYKLFIVCMAVFASLVLNIVFRWQWVRNQIVERLVVDVRERLFSDYDFRKAFDKKLEEKKS